MSSHYSGSRASHRRPVVEQVSSARPEAARRSAPDVHRSTRHDRDRDLHPQTSRLPQHRTVEPTHDEAVELAEAGSSWGQRFERSHKLEDLQRAIVAQERAFELMHEDHPERLRLLDDLGLSLWHRFNHLGKLDDLERSITLREQILDRTSDDDPDYHARQLSTLAISLHVRYQHLGELNDLRESSAKKKAALRLTPENHPDRPRQLSNLGNSLYLLFERLGDIQDIEEAITTHRRAVDLTPEGHPVRLRRLDGLANSLAYRFDRLGDIRDLEEAIAAGRQSVELMPDGHPEHPRRLGNLAVSLSARFIRLRDTRDLEEMIAAELLCVKLTPESHPDRPLRLGNLANSLNFRFERFGNMQDLENAVKAYTQAIESTPEQHPDRPMWLTNLTNSLRSRYEYLGEIRDLESAINAHKLALDSTPDNHPDRPVRLYSFGLTLKARFKCEKSKTRFDDALDSFMEATMQPLGSPTFRLQSAQQCVSLLSEYPRFSSAELVLSAHSRIIEIFPEIVWLGHSLERRYKELTRLGPEINATISAFIRLESRFQAIEWMEMGRSFVWAQMSSLREPLEELEKAHPQLATELREVSSVLQYSGGSSQSSLQSLEYSRVGGVTTGVGTTGNLSEQRLGAAIQYERILKDIRALPDFADFLRPAKIKSLLPAIGRLDGPVVFINVHSSSCDALTLFPNGGIEHIALSELSESGSHNLRSTWVQFLSSSYPRTRGVVPPERLVLVDRRTNIFGTVLWKIWVWIVRPILQALDLMNSSAPSGRLPHITWCPTGPITQLPLHAAGIYDFSDASRSQHVFDYVVSSYTPSLSALIRSREALRTCPSQPAEILVIAQPATPRYTPLPHTQEEHTRLAAVLRDSSLTVLNDKEATNEAVVSALQDSTWVHLACHGYQDSNNPTQSAFALYDGPLTLLKLMATSAKNSELAFLSACETAVGDAKIPEESVHLAAGMLAVGFKGVIATMWSIRDDDAPVIVQSYYKELLEIRRAGRAGEGYTGAAYALHVATAMLRRQVGEQNFARWAPFVHFGV